MEIVFILIGLVIGIITTYLWAKPKFGAGTLNQDELNALKLENQTLQNHLNSTKESYTRSEKERTILKQERDDKEAELRTMGSLLATTETKLAAAEKARTQLDENAANQLKENTALNEQLKTAERQIAKLEVAEKGSEKEIQSLSNKLTKIGEQLEEKSADFNTINQKLATADADNKALVDKLDTQKKEIEALGKKFNTEFQNIANKILEEKTAKFTNVNKESLETILKPLGENIDKFKKQVEDSYANEAKERFSLGEQVKEMAKLNKIISDEARNLTTALKGEAKTQGNWGEMILESILEKSGLRKNEEYFIEHQLKDENGKALRTDAENKKMRPDAVIKYPDNRSVIIDSKVSLNAFTRYLSATEKDEQDIALNMHLDAIKNHIVALSTKGYDDYDKALDFVMMFIPSEPAYIAAMQADPNLWNFAYDKRILLMNPTNLIISLKLIVDLWKREYQNQNAVEIANRGAKLYDKFVGFVTNLEDVGNYITRAQGKYTEAYKQLSTGNDNLVLQATKLKKLGIKNKKELPKNIENLGIE